MHKAEVVSVSVAVLSADVVTVTLGAGMVTERNSATGCPEHFSKRHSSNSPTPTKIETNHKAPIEKDG
jgi:hypothetical protein